MLLEWPLQSTELNIIENLYVDIKCELRINFFLKKTIGWIANSSGVHIAKKKLNYITRTVNH